MPATIYHGAVINPQSLTSYNALPACLLAISPAGHVEWIVEDVQDDEIQEVMTQRGCLDATVVALKHGEFIMPGFIDTHTVCPSPQCYARVTEIAPVACPSSSKYREVSPHTWLPASVRSFIVQYSGQQHELLDWLDKVTFPMEAKFSDVEFARRVYASVVGRKVDSGVC